jgi:hypothetical protein
MQVHDYIELFLRHQAKDWQYQTYQEIMQAPLYALIGSRQQGKSLLISIVAISLALGYENLAGERVPAADVLIVSKDRNTSTNIISMVRKHLEAAQAITGKKAFRTDIGGKGDVYLMNGTRIVSMPGTPRSLQGFTGNVIVDELSANRWSIDEMMGQAMSVTSARSYFKLVVATNADVEGSYTHLFFESDDPRWVELRKNWVMRSVNIHDVYPDGLPERLELRRQAMSQAMWQRFYLNKFIGSGAGLIEKDQFELVDRLPTGKIRYCIAIDPGFSDKGNPTGVCVLGFANNRYYVAHGNLWFNKTVEEQEKYIKFLINVYRPEKLLIDAGAQGWHLAKKFESYQILEKVNVSQKYTDTCFNVLTNLLEEKRVSIVTEDLVERSLPPSVGYEELLVDYCSVVPAMEQGAGVDFPQRVVRDTDSRLLKAGATRTNKVHADACLALLYCMSWAAKAMSTSRLTVGMLPMPAGRGGGGIY